MLPLRSLKATGRIASSLPPPTTARRPLTTTRTMAAKQEWLIIVPDHAGVLEKRMEVRPYIPPPPSLPILTLTFHSQHLEGIKPNVEAGTVVFGGATLSEPIKEGEQMKSNGSAMLVQAESREEALKVVEGDIYTKSGVWDTSKVCCGDARRREWVV